MMGPTTRSDAEARSLARSLWGGVEAATDALAREMQRPPIDPSKPFDVDFVLAEMVQLNLLAVADHARSMTLLAVQPKLGPSSATIARGAVESLARIRWVAAGTTEDELRMRALVVLHSDVDHAAFATEFIGADRHFDRREYLALVTAQIKTLGLPRPKWALRNAVREAADEVWRTAGLDDWTPYSQLSAAAHGMQPALGALLGAEGLRLPRQEIVNHIGFTYGIADRALRRLQNCPLPLLANGALERTWLAQTQRLTPIWTKLKEEDNADVVLRRSRPTPST